MSDAPITVDRLPIIERSVSPPQRNPNFPQPPNDLELLFSEAQSQIGPILEASTIKPYDLRKKKLDLSTSRNGRLVFGAINGLSYDKKKVLLGLFIGKHFTDVNNDQPKEIVYYPHIRNSEITGNSQFILTSDQVVQLAHYLCTDLGIEQTDLIRELQEFHSYLQTGITRFRPQDWELYDNSLIPYLVEKLNPKPQSI